MAAASPEPAFVLRGHESCVHCLTFATDGAGKEVLVSGDESGLVKVWDFETNRSQHTFSTGSVAVLGLKAAGRHLCTQTKAGTLCLWDWERIGAASEGPCSPTAGIQVELHSFCKFVRVGSQGPVDGSEESLVLAAPGKGGIEVGLWDTRTKEFRSHYRPQDTARADPSEKTSTGMCTALCTVGEGHLLGAYEDGTVRLWDLRRQEAMLVTKLHSEPIFGLGAGPLKQGSSSQIEKAACVSGGADPCIVFSKLDNLDRETSKENLKGGNEFDGDRESAAFLEDSRIDLGGAGAKGINSISVRHDGKVAAAGCWDGRLRLYACKKPRLLASLQCHGKGVQCVEFSPATRLLASASEDTRIAVWDVYR